MLNLSQYEAVVIGGSAGALDALEQLLFGLPEDFDLPIILVLHLHSSDEGELANFLNERMKAVVKEAEEKESICSGTIYVAPSSYHLLIEPDKTFSLSKEAKVNYARPSIDVLFESAAFDYINRLVGIILSSTNHDGAKGISKIKFYGGLTISQTPAMAEYPVMPQAAVDTGDVDLILPVAEILRFLASKET